MLLLALASTGITGCVSVVDAPVAGLGSFVLPVPGVGELTLVIYGSGCETRPAEFLRTARMMEPNGRCGHY